MAIAGAGLAGAYLYRLLRNQGQEVDVFDIQKKTRCGLTPCAWGTSRGFKELVAAAGLNPETYILRRVDHLYMDEMKIKADLMTFDKPKLIRDLLKGAKINYEPPALERYERIVDATGVSRVFLPVIDDDITMGCVQSLVEKDGPLNNRIRLGGIGFAWCFPLSENAFHIGCGSMIKDPQRRLKELGWLQESPSQPNQKILCSCQGRIRLTGPHHSLPFVSRNAGNIIWGVGEAIGCVAPLAGDGVVPGLRSVQILMGHWDDSEGYTRAILREFTWMKKERRVIDKLRYGELLGVRDAWVLRKNAKRMGMRIRLIEAQKLMHHLV
jgi:flavin-dependent dehydrogenase